MSWHPSRVRARLLLCSLATLTVGACASNPDPELVPDTDVRIAPPPNAVKFGDCPEALRRAAAKPDLEVDHLPTPKAMTPPAIQVKAMPDEVRRARYSEVRVTVLVDTLGHADMRTFNVVRTTHPWLASSVRSAVTKWRFEPAQLAGCKVPRLFKWGATAGGERRAR
jgi:outer membrane biosynthesis protein TonB